MVRNSYRWLLRTPCTRKRLPKTAYPSEGGGPPLTSSLRLIAFSLKQINGGKAIEAPTHPVKSPSRPIIRGYSKVQDVLVNGIVYRGRNRSVAEGGPIAR